MSSGLQVFGGIVVVALAVVALFSSFTAGPSCRWYEIWNSDEGMCINRCERLLGDRRKDCLDGLELEARGVLDEVRDLRRH